MACRDYADRAEALCRACAASALETAEAAKAAQGEVLTERARLISELERNAAVNEALCETVYFLLQCSDLSQAKRDEAEAIFRRGREAMKHEANEQHEEV